MKWRCRKNSNACIRLNAENHGNNRVDEMNVTNDLELQKKFRTAKIMWRKIKKKYDKIRSDDAGMVKKQIRILHNGSQFSFPLVQSVDCDDAMERKIRTLIVTELVELEEKASFLFQTQVNERAKFFVEQEESDPESKVKEMIDTLSSSDSETDSSEHSNKSELSVDSSGLKEEQERSEMMRLASRESLSALHELFRRSRFGDLTSSQYAGVHGLSDDGDDGASDSADLRTKAAQVGQASSADMEDVGLTNIPVVLDLSKSLEEPMQDAFVESVLYPRVAVMWRDIGEFERDGLLLDAKFVAAERAFLGWLQAPTDALLRAILKITSEIQSRLVSFGKLVSQQKSEQQKQPTLLVPSEMRKRALSRAKEKNETESKKLQELLVSRTRPTWKRWRSLSTMFTMLLPIFICEPTYKELATLRFRPISNDEDSYGPFEDVAADLCIFRDVPLCEFEYYVPDSAGYPRTFDVLRVDILTLGGLISSGVGIIRSYGKFYILLPVILSAFSYASRVFYTLRSSTARVGRMLAERRLRRLYAKDGAAVATLRSLATEQEIRITLGVLSIARAQRINPSDLLHSATQLKDDVKLWLESYSPGQRDVDDAIDRALSRLNTLI
eukprot:CAMPEP_0182448858 /NCGR_PEP_ID=MMETSP1172-20130603/30272_1 /TAXON_ID=708627 /ORGANISM="Timspurckia oligopyrenoides, Strain CCMP3278" /LENGTH=612 /DNA_ID=CAMNT_0024645889 /DNA_START=102 /DNA_END=1940 /DNA_ORIENTATION=+